MQDDNLLDLDTIAPPSRYVKFKGKTLEVKPLTLNQMIELTKFNQEFQQLDNVDQFIPFIRKSLGAVIPDLMKQDGVDLNASQLIALVNFALSGKKKMDDKEPEVDPKKKESDSVSSSPDSSTSTPDTHSEPSSTSTQ